jgi:hypothetical protein
MGAPIYHDWYDGAQVGTHHQMGDNVVHDYGPSKQTAVALEVVLEKGWEEAQDSAKKRLEIA